LVLKGAVPFIPFSSAKEKMMKIQKWLSLPLPEMWQKKWWNSRSWF